MQQQDLVNVILVLIEEKQNNGEFGTIRLSKKEAGSETEEIKAN